MQILILGLTYAICITSQECSAIHYIEIPVIVTYSPPQPSTERSFMAKSFRGTNPKRSARRLAGYEDERDLTIKTKISVLVDQMLYDTDRTITLINLLITQHKETYAYKAGILMSQVKRNRDIINEIFDAAVKNKDTWTAIDVLKFYEVVVTVSVETSNLVDDLMNVHKEQLAFEVENQKQEELANKQIQGEGNDAAETASVVTIEGNKPTLLVTPEANPPTVPPEPVPPEPVPPEPVPPEPVPPEPVPPEPVPPEPVPPEPVPPEPVPPEPVPPEPVPPEPVPPEPVPPENVPETS